jgi:hypothetical protein
MFCQKKEVKKEKVVVAAPFRSRLPLQLMVFLESNFLVAKKIKKINKCFVITILNFF